MAVYKYALPVVLDGFTSEIDIDVSAYVADATQGIWTFYDIDFTTILGAPSPINAGTVRIVVQPAPPAGTYRLVGLQ